MSWYLSLLLFSRLRTILKIPFSRNTPTRVLYQSSLKMHHDMQISRKYRKKTKDSPGYRLGPFCKSRKNAFDFAEPVDT
jgi:hypothetical protein